MLVGGRFVSETSAPPRYFEAGSFLMKSRLACFGFSVHIANRQTIPAKISPEVTLLLPHSSHSPWR